MLLVQGGRDYQATVADDLSRWRAGLGRRPDVAIRVYPADNHFFFPGTGPSSPAELAAAQHLDPEVVADVADWLSADPTLPGIVIPTGVTSLTRFCTLARPKR